VSLEGSIDTIALPDLLGLLAATGKTGELRVRAERPVGRMWLRDGLLVASEAGRARSHLDALFELFRIPVATFAFDLAAPAPHPGDPTEVPGLLAAVEARLLEWRDIVAVIPSLEHLVALADELPGSEATICAEQWRLLSAAAGGRRVGDILERLDLGEFDGCRGLRGLCDDGLVRVLAPEVRTEPVADRPMVPVAIPDRRSAPDADRLRPERPVPPAGVGAEAGAETDRRAGRARAGDSVVDMSERPPAPVDAEERDAPAAELVVVDDGTCPAEAGVERVLVGARGAVGTGAAATSRRVKPAPAGDAVVALAQPRAAKGDPAASPRPAAAAAAPPVRRAPAPEAVSEPEAAEGDGPVAEDMTDADGEPINRGLLLKFLSSVRT